MRIDLKRVLLGAAAAGSLVAGHVHAQEGQQNLSAQEVRDFFESAEQDVTRAVQAGDYARLLDWTKDHVAEGATFLLSQELYVGDERKSLAVTSIDKQDMLRLGRLATGLMSDMSPEAIRDYSLEIEVTGVDPIGPNAATATTQITESGKLALSAEGEAQQAHSRPAEIQATAQCRHLVRRDDGSDRLMIGMTNCQARARL